MGEDPELLRKSLAGCLLKARQGSNAAAEPKGEKQCFAFRESTIISANLRS